MNFKKQVSSYALQLILLVTASNVSRINAMAPRSEAEVADTHELAQECLSLQLFFAAQEGNEEQVRSLLRHPEIEVNYRLPETAAKFGSFTPLMIAIVFDHPDVVRLLLEHTGVDVTLQNKDGWDALSIAVRHPASLKLLLECQKAAKLSPALDVNARVQGGRTALYYALEGSWWLSAVLLSTFPGVDPNICPNSQIFLLHAFARASSHDFELPEEKSEELAIHFQRLQTIMFALIERGLLVNYTDEQGKTPLDACFVRPARMGEFLWPFLYACHAQPGLSSQIGGLASPSIKSLHERVRQDGLSRHLWVNLDEAVTAFPAVFHDQIKEFAHQGASMVELDSYSLTPCMILAARGETEALQHCLGWYPEIQLNARSCAGWQALHFAAYNGRIDMIKYLLSLPAIETHPRTNSGLTPYAVAEIGAKARLVDSEAKPDFRARNIIEHYNKRRRAVLLSLYRIQRNMPKDIKRLLARLYRL